MATAAMPDQRGLSMPARNLEQVVGIRRGLCAGLQHRVVAEIVEV